MGRDSHCAAIIPALGTSPDVPRRHTRLLAGKPLVGHAIEQARLSRRVSRVVVSTDDDETAEVARRLGVDVVMRLAGIGGSAAAVHHALEDLRLVSSHVPDIAAVLRCEFPLTLASDIDGTIAALEDENADCSLAVTRAAQCLWTRGADGQPLSIGHEKSPQYLETGAVHALRVSGFLEARRLVFGKAALYGMPRERTFEINTLEDFEVAEVLIRRQSRAARREMLPNPVGAVVFDFDGVFTDNRVLTMHDGQEGVLCDRSDGLGVGMLKATGLPMFVLSKEVNPVVAARCRKLKLEFRQGIEEKVPVLREWLAERGIDTAHTVYVGNDVNDLGCLGLVGCGVAVADAYPEAKAAARFILSRPGGMGAVREICDLIRAALEGGPDAP